MAEKNDKRKRHLPHIDTYHRLSGSKKRRTAGLGLEEEGRSERPTKGPSSPYRLLHDGGDLHLDVAGHYGRVRVVAAGLALARFPHHDEQADGDIPAGQADLTLILKSKLAVVGVVGEGAGLEVDGAVFRVGLCMSAKAGCHDSS